MITQTQNLIAPCRTRHSHVVQGKKPYAARLALCALCILLSTQASTNPVGQQAANPLGPSAPLATTSASNTAGSAKHITPVLPIASTPAQEAATATALMELGLALLRQGEAGAQPHAAHATGTKDKAASAPGGNTVISPFSLVAALAMLQTGSSGNSARELNTLLGSNWSGQRIYSTHLPWLMQRLRTLPAAEDPEAAFAQDAPLVTTRALGKSGISASAKAKEQAIPAAVVNPLNPLPFTMVNRMWVDGALLASVPASYSQQLHQRYQADASALNVSEPENARKTVNDWIAQATAQQIPTLLPEGAVTPNTKLILTNAIHFKSPWLKPFNPTNTAPKPFHSQASVAPKMVPTMQDERRVNMAIIDKVLVLELPFAGNGFSLVIAMPPAERSLNALQNSLEGSDLAAWRSQLKSQTCRLALPKFRIAPVSQSLKGSLQAMGVQTVFGPEADFSAMLGQAGKGVELDNVFQSATIVIDELGGEAAAATGAVATAKSFALPAPACAVDRPFLFAVVHQATGTPLFMGRVVVPG